MAGQASDESHVQSGPVNGYWHSHAPQLHVPTPLHSEPLTDGHGVDEQLHVGPKNGGRHWQAPHRHVPWPAQVKLVPGSTGQASDESQSQNSPVQGGMHVHWPQLHTPLPGPPQLPGQGSVEQLHVGGLDQPGLHRQLPQSQMPRPLAVHWGSHVAARLQSHGMALAPVPKGAKHWHAPHTHAPWPWGARQSVSQGSVEQLHDGPLHSGAHSHTPHLQTPLGALQLFGQASEVSHSHASPVKGKLHWHVPHSHVPAAAPLHTAPATSGHGVDEQLQFGPPKPGSQMHVPQLHTPLPEHGLAGAPGHTSDVSQSHSVPFHGLMHWHWPHTQTPLGELQFWAQGSVEHEQSGPVQPIEHLHVSHSHVPRGAWHVAGHVSLERVVQGGQPGSMSAGARHWHWPHTHEPRLGPPQSVAQGACEQLHDGPSHSGLHLHVPHSHTPPPAAKEQLPSAPPHVSETSHRQPEPDQPTSHLHAPHSHVPCALHCWPRPLASHGSDEQLQLAPVRPGSHWHAPHTQSPRPEHSRPPRPSGQLSKAPLHSHCSPEKGGLHWHAPHTHTPLPLQLLMQGNELQLHEGPCQDTSHWHTPHTQLPLRHGGLQAAA